MNVANRRLALSTWAETGKYAWKQFCRSSSTAARLVNTEIVDKVGWVYLSDPHRRNALTVAMGEQFLEAVEEMTAAANSGKIRACVVTGDEKGGAFSAGGDLRWLRERHLMESAYTNARIMVDFYKRFLSVRNIPVPTIAAINGAAIGAGMCMTLACDFRLAVADAKIGFTFAKLGIHPGMGCSTLLPRVVSQEYATYLLATGKIISASKAMQRGLIFESVQGAQQTNESNQEALRVRATDLARELASGAPIAVQSCIHTLRNQKFDGMFDTLLWREADSQAIAYSSKDFGRGLDAVESKASFVDFEGC